MLSSQQQRFVDWVQTGQGNAILMAVAGAGKTHTVTQAAVHMRGFVSLVAYNKKAGEELKARLAKLPIDQRKVQAGTFHSFGFRALLRAFPGVKVNGSKMLDIVAPLLRELPDDVASGYLSFVTRLVSLAKQSAFGVLCDIDDRGEWLRLVDHFDVANDLPEDADPNTGISLAIRALNESIVQNRQHVDFDDMIFAAIYHPVRMFQVDWLVVDEAQDTNPARRCLAKKMLRPGGRFVAVGDPRQAIYGFTGADNDSLDIIAREFNAQRFPLTTCYRCSTAVIAEAQKIVPEITAKDDAIVGTVEDTTFEKMLPGKGPALPVPGDVILCRNVRPLVMTAFDLLKRGVPAFVEGRDIGRDIAKLATRWKRVKKLSDLAEVLDAYRKEQTDKLMAKGRELQAAAIADRVDTLQVMIEAAEARGETTVTQLVAYLDTMFKDSEGAPHAVLLSTVHKSKGREWDRVWLLGPNQYMPSRYARQEWQAQQEQNLIYVAITRAAATLVRVHAVPDGKDRTNGQ